MDGYRFVQTSSSSLSARALTRSLADRSRDLFSVVDVNDAVVVAKVVDVVVAKVVDVDVAAAIVDDEVVIVGACW